MQNTVAVIITYNPDLEIIRNQFLSVISQINHIVYVDNCSDNQHKIISYIQDISQKNENIYFCLNSKNLGLGKAQNQGIEQAQKLGATHILLLDHDSVLQPDFVKELLDAEQKLMEQHYKVGAIGPTYINEATHEIYPITKYTGPFIKRIIPTNKPVEASFLISSGCLIRMSVLNEVGKMNEDLFVDYIDVEWSYRVRSSGYKLFAIPTAIMNHIVGDKRISVFGRKISVHSPLRRYYLTRNSFHMIRWKYVSLGYKIREIFFNLFRIIIFALISNQRIKYLQYSFKGFFDGIKGVAGEYKSKS